MRWLCLIALTPLLSLCAASLAAGEEIVGYLEPGRTIKISSAEPGIVHEVRVREGQAVKAGEMLARLDTRVLEIEARIAAEERVLLKRRLEKLRKLMPQKFASEDEVLKAESDLKIVELRQERVQAEIERLTLRSPIDGVVTEMRYDLAESVPGANAHIATVVQLDPMRVQFTLPPDEAARLVVGASVGLFFPERGLRRDGIVDFVSPVATAVVNTVRVRIAVPKPEAGLLAGARCQFEGPRPLASSNLAIPSHE